MSRDIAASAPPQGLGATIRTDRWWIEPLLTGLGFLSFVIYSSWAAFQGEHYFHGSYLSPFYSPLIFVDDAAVGSAPLTHAWFGAWPDSLPGWIPRSPALLILAAPLSFRATCYYYRKFYYRSYFMSPPGCAVGGARQGKYKGETRLFLFQNLHRYTLYIALFYIAVLYYDAYHSFFRVVDGESVFGVGVGSIVLTLNPTLLAFYTLGCHSFRHLVGGQLDCFSCDKVSGTRKSLWDKITVLNGKHMMWAWISLIGVGFSDLYVRLVSMGIWKDWSTWS